MQKLATNPLVQFSPKARERNSLDEIIDLLQRRQADLQRRLSAQSNGVQKRRLKIALQVAKLQEKKALALRANRARG